MLVVIIIMTVTMRMTNIMAMMMIVVLFNILLSVCQKKHRTVGKRALFATYSGHCLRSQWMIHSCFCWLQRQSLLYLLRMPIPSLVLICEIHVDGDRITVMPIYACAATRSFKMRRPQGLCCVESKPEPEGLQLYIQKKGVRQASLELVFSSTVWLRSLVRTSLTASSCMLDLKALQTKILLIFEKGM